MKNKLTQIILIGTVVCFLLFNVHLLFLNQQYIHELDHTNHRLERLENVEFMFEISKELTVTRFQYEQHHIGNADIYLGSDKYTGIPLQSVTNQPKLILGLNQNMCRPCVDAVLADIKEVFPDYESNPNIIYIADVEERFKDDYYGKKVISFKEKEIFPLYEIDMMPYFFILDKDLCVKLLFITDKTSPELTKEYLKIIKKRYMEI